MLTTLWRRADPAQTPPRQASLDSSTKSGPFCYHGVLPQNLEDALLGHSLMTFGWVWLVVAAVLIVCGFRRFSGSQVARWLGVLARAVGGDLCDRRPSTARGRRPTAVFDAEPDPACSVATPAFQDLLHMRGRRVDRLRVVAGPGRLTGRPARRGREAEPAGEARGDRRGFAVRLVQEARPVRPRRGMVGEDPA